MHCDASLCRNASEFNDDERKIEIGSGQTVINVSTHNGPVKVATNREVL
jgi:hypothetical protein